jgi:acyl carrier protein
MLAAIDTTLKEQILCLAIPKITKEAITHETNLIDHLGFDSVKLVQMIMELEDAFGIIFEDEDMDVDVLTNYGALQALIIQKTQNG